jgi:PTH1 family peptidyl-tRNA hydrolase
VPRAATGAIRCIVGIGNPTDQYANTKHNVGWWVVDELASRHNVHMKRERLRAIYGRGRIGGLDIVLAKPTTYVNLTGDAALRLAIFFGIKPSEFLVVLDDMNLPTGQIRLRRDGSDGGHKGLRSMIQTFGTMEIPRLRIGIGAPEGRGGGVDWVLTPFDKETMPLIQDAVKRAGDCIETILKDGLEIAMTKYNG